MPTLPHPLARGCLLLAAALTAMLPLCSGAPAAEPTKAPDAPKTHMLYMGSDFQIQYEGALYPVKGVIGGSFVINVKGKSVRIPTDRGQFAMKIVPDLKLTDETVRIDNLKGEQRYTLEADPNRKWMARMNDIAGAANDNADRADAIMRATAQTVTEIGPGGIAHVSPNPEYAPAERSATNAANMARSDLTNPGFYMQKLQEELDQKLFDALEISFEITPTKPLDTPYLVVITQFKERNKPNSTANLIYAQELDPLRAEPVRIKKIQAGFPPGFVLEKYQVHIYDDGREIASNVSEMQNPLTADEALQYLIIDHISKHRSASAPAALALGKFPPNVRTLLGEKRYAQPYFVRISKNGLPLGVFTDQNCTEKADPEVTGMIEKLRFVPVIEKGKPVEGTARLKIADIAP